MALVWLHSVKYTHHGPHYEGRIRREGGGGCLGVRTPPPLWGTPKLHKVGGNVACVCANTPRFSTKQLHGPPLSEILYPYLITALILWFWADIEGHGDCIRLPSPLQVFLIILCPLTTPKFPRGHTESHPLKFNHLRIVNNALFIFRNMFFKKFVE